MFRRAHILLFFFIGFNIKATTTLRPNIAFLFTNGSLISEVGNYRAKAYGVSLVNDRFGNENSACYTQGDLGSYINLGTDNVLKPKSGSISLWIKLVHRMLHGKGVECNPILFTKSRDSIDHCEGYQISYVYTTKNLNVCLSVSREHVITLYSKDTINKEQWQHIVMTFDKNYLCFYLNGKLESKVTKKFENEYLEGDSVIVGNIYTNKNERYFNGCVDDIQFFDKVLTIEEVTELYNAPNPNKNSKIINWLILILSIIAFVLIIIYLIRLRLNSLLKKEKEKNDLKYKALEFEIRMLKAQMDPHFIFNSLNTILEFIISQQNNNAEVYLAKFSKLLRKLLVSNTSESISLLDEIEIIEKYLEIETLRFETVFNHTIFYPDNISLSKTFIPHMLIQPFVENAIWHGLRSKSGDKKLDITFEIINSKTLFCIIEDNGVGRDTKINYTEKDKSLALNFINQRLDLMSKIHKNEYNFLIVDKKDNNGQSLGTRIELKIPIIST